MLVLGTADVLGTDDFVTICSASPTLKRAADKVPIVYSWSAVFTQAQKNGQVAGVAVVCLLAARM